MLHIAVTGLYTRLTNAEGASWFATVGWFFLVLFLLFRFRGARAAARAAKTPKSNEDMSKELVPPKGDSDA